MGMISGWLRVGPEVSPFQKEEADMYGENRPWYAWPWTWLFMLVVCVAYPFVRTPIWLRKRRHKWGTT